jgi:hypothetical protein
MFYIGINRRTFFSSFSSRMHDERRLPDLLSDVLGSSVVHRRIQFQLLPACNTDTHLRPHRSAAAGFLRCHRSRYVLNYNIFPFVTYLHLRIISITSAAVYPMLWYCWLKTTFLSFSAHPTVLSCQQPRFISRCSYSVGSLYGEHALPAPDGGNVLPLSPASLQEM